MCSTITGRTVVIGAVAVLIGVAAGVLIVMTTRSARRDQAVLTAMGGGSETATAPSNAGAPSAGVTPPGSEPAGEGGSAPTDAGTTEASDAPSADAGADATVAALVPLCADVTARRDEAVRAAQAALDNWKTHYGAQLAFERGEISSDEAARRWTASKEPAQRNLDALAAATEAIGSGTPCARLADDGAVTGATADGIEACVARSDLATRALDAAQEPLQGWRDHLHLMAAKDRYSTDEYLRMWDRMVADAPGEMRGFDRAVADWRDASACEPAA